MTQDSSTSGRKLGSATIDWLFEKMSLMWGKKFTDQWGGVLASQNPDPAKRQQEINANATKLKGFWAESLGEISELEFRRGVTKMKGLDWPPSLPEFLKLCRPEVNPLNAYYEALEGCRSRERGEVGTWSHPAIFWAAVRVTAFELNNQSYSQIRTRWETALAAELAKDQWEPIAAPMIALAAPAKGKLSRESATKMIEQIKGISILSAAKKDPVLRGDGKDWARKILQRKKDGDKTLLPVQIQYARQALQEFDEGKDDE